MRTYKWDKRELVNAALYITKTGCQWRNFPHDFPPWKTVYSFFRRANINGLWDGILEFLIEITRQAEGKQPEPTYTIIDSQSVKTVGASEQRGIDGGKKLKVVNDTSFVDVLGNLLAIVVHAANIHDTVSGIIAARKAVLAYPGIIGFCANAGYKGTFETDMWEIFQCGVDISEKIKPKEWEILPWRWIVERTLAWINTFRRLSKDYEIKTFSAESFVKIAKLHTLLKRL